MASSGVRGWSNGSASRAIREAPVSALALRALRSCVLVIPCLDSLSNLLEASPRNPSSNSPMRSMLTPVSFDTALASYSSTIFSTASRSFRVIWTSSNICLAIFGFPFVSVGVRNIARDVSKSSFSIEVPSFPRVSCTRARLCLFVSASLSCSDNCSLVDSSSSVLACTKLSSSAILLCSSGSCSTGWPCSSWAGCSALAFCSWRASFSCPN